MASRVWSMVVLLAAVAQGPGAAADKLAPLAPDDLYLLEGPQAVVAAPQGDRGTLIRRWVDFATKQERYSLWWVDGDSASARPIEPAEPDAHTVTFSPDGRWMAIRSTRPRPASWKQTPPASESDAATDISLVSSDGRRVLPLAGPDKPYGRVFNDPFYGRVAFSHDGKRLVFVADDGRDPRTQEELEANVQIVRPDQGEGYTGYTAAQVWIADLDEAPQQFAAHKIRRLTNDEIWYGDPQWMPDGRNIICHANKTTDVESVRYSINKNYDLWGIDVNTGAQCQITSAPGPEISPRISPDGNRLICLGSPRKGPHADVFNLVMVPLTPHHQSQPQTLYDHHAESAGDPPHPIPAFPLPEDCWDGSVAVVYTNFAGVHTKEIRLDVTTGRGAELGLDPPDADSPLQQRLALQRRLSPPRNGILRERLQAEDRVVTWQNEGWNLEGVLTVPPREVAQPPYPLIVYPHGGPHSRSTQSFNFTAQVFAARGYAVFQPNFRGSTGYGRRFLEADHQDLGGGDMRDILKGIDRLVEQKLVDRERQFVYGVSYGGFMASWLVGHTGQFRAAVAQNAVTDMNVMWGLGDLQSWTQHELGGLPWEIPDAMRKHSPLAYAGNINTPTLILNSREDRRCPVAMGRMFHQALLARSVPTQMVIYPGEGHGIRQPKHQVDVLRRTLAWFAAHDVEQPSKATEQKPDWVRVNEQAAWQPRDSQGELVYHDRLWIMGGWFDSYHAPPRDVWSSPDGKSWQRVSAEAPWKHSDLPMTIAFRDKMWLMGGWYNGRLPGHSASNAVWSSTDGAHWEQATSAAAWTPRLAGTLVEFKGRMWLLGGTEDYYFGDQAALKNDVWHSDDGEHWTLATANAGWSPRAYHQAAVLDDKLYVFGGGNYTPEYHATNDVWSSSDGIHWSQVTAAAPWHPRLWFSSVVYRDQIWVLGGWSNDPAKNWDDVWHSRDGKDWRQLKTERGWKPRHEHSAFVLQDKIWIAGGHAQPLSSEVWSLELPPDFGSAE